MKIRSIPAVHAVSAAREAARWLKGQGARHILFKICSTFDSTDGGNIGPVTTALRADLGGGLVLVTPTSLETGRTVFSGNLFVNGAPLNESPLKDHPLNPMHDANLVRVMQRQTSEKVGLIDEFTIEKGIDAVRARMDALAKSGHGAVIVDALFERDLEIVGTIASSLPLSAGASGLGLGLARAFVRSGAVGADHVSHADLGEVGGHSAIVAGSCSKATLQQIAIAERDMPVLRLNQGSLIRGEGEVERALTWAAERISSGPVLIAASGGAAEVADIQAKFGREASGYAIERGTAAIAAGLVDLGVRRLVVAGGETSGATVDRLSIPAFSLGPEIAPGVPLLRTIGQAGPDLLMALKSGNFGSPEFFAKALSMMR
jgi:uncharacterized protein YgbK (DUF1537 family)